MSDVPNIHTNLISSRTWSDGKFVGNIANASYQQIVADWTNSPVEKSVDLIIADPPYELDMGTWDKTGSFGPDQMAELISNCYRILRDGGTALVFNTQSNVLLMRELILNREVKHINNDGSVTTVKLDSDVMFDVHEVIAWHKKNANQIGDTTRDYFSRGAEWILFITKEPSGQKPDHYWTFNLLLGESAKSPVFEYSAPNAKRVHVTQKPEALMEDLILTHSNIGDTIFEPYAGSGAATFAALKMRRNAVASELDPDNFNAIDSLGEHADWVDWPDFAEKLRTDSKFFAELIDIANAPKKEFSGKKKFKQFQNIIGELNQDSSELIKADKALLDQLNVMFGVKNEVN